MSISNWYRKQQQQKKNNGMHNKNYVMLKYSAFELLSIFFFKQAFIIRWKKN